MYLDVSRFTDNHRIIVDTCSLMDPSGLRWVSEKLQPHLKASRRRLIVPVGVQRELQKHAGRENEAADHDDRRRNAKSALELISTMLREESAALFGEDDDPFVDALILSVVTRKRTTLDFLVVTQDRNLARDLIQLGASASIKSRHELAVARVSKASILHAWNREQLFDDHPTSTAQRATYAEANSVKGAVKAAENPILGARSQRASSTTLPAATGQIRLDATPVGPATAPTLGAEVSLEGGAKLRLARQLARGGEGTIYETGHGRVAKIYHPGALTRTTLEKLELMTKARPSISEVCWPEAVLRDGSGAPVGFLMPAADGFPLDVSVFKKPLLEKKLPDWTRLNLVRLAAKVADTVGALHAAGLILGDINPNNIMVTPAGKVTFVDLDSAQVGDHPCPVGMINFTRPEHHGEPFGSFLRTTTDDLFALAVMIFMILVPGKPPYSHEGGGDPGENIRKRHFPYPSKNRSVDGIPDGPWRFIWSHLSYNVKETFVAAFVREELPTPRDWVTTLKRYETAISKGGMDPEQGNMVFPTRLKRVSKEVQDTHGFQQAERIEFTCSSCGKKFEMSARAASRSEKPICRLCQKAHTMDDAPLKAGATTTTVGGRGPQPLKVSGNQATVTPTIQTSPSPTAQHNVSKWTISKSASPTATTTLNQPTPSILGGLVSWLKGK